MPLIPAEAEAGGSLSLRSAWSTRASSRIARVIQRKCASKINNK